MQNDDYKDDYTPGFDEDIPDDRDAPPNTGRWNGAPQEDDRRAGPGDGWETRSTAGNTTGNRQSRQGSGNRNNRFGGKNSSGNARAKNASGAGSGKKGKKEPINFRESPSARPVHRIVPCLLLAFAVFLLVCMFLNLVSGENAESPATHPVGAVGYGVCFAFFGLFGGGFLLPFLLGYLAVMWRRLLDRHRLVEKAVTVTVLQVLLSTFIHSCGLGALEKTERYLTVGELFRTGARMQGGGFVGGGIGYFLCSRMNIFGAILITVLLLLVAFFFFIGMTPQHLYARIRAKVTIARAQRRKEDTEEVDSAPIMDRMEKKHERASGRRTDNPEEEPASPPPGAVTYPNGRPTAKAVVRRDSPLLTDEDNPVPVMPILDATDETPADSPLFVPKEIGEKLAGEDRKSAAETARTDKPAKAEPAAQSEQPAKAAPAVQTAPGTQASPHARRYGTRACRIRRPQPCAGRKARQWIISSRRSPASSAMQPAGCRNPTRALNSARSLLPVPMRRFRKSGCMSRCRRRFRCPARSGGMKTRLPQRRRLPRIPPSDPPIPRSVWMGAVLPPPAVPHSPARHPRTARQHPGPVPQPEPTVSRRCGRQQSKFRAISA